MTDSATARSTDGLRHQLQATLGTAYTIERELHAGGMSRVFVATESALGRKVVVKVLSPDLAGVNIDRFRREILLAAQLQHPHIVPVLSAGEMHGIPFYTMPFIDGQSLRTRLSRGEVIEGAEVLRILHDVIDALACAHSRGIVHRDIKPDNILMSGRHAVVLDFGVAKALSAANPRAGGQGDTSGGVVIGTPAYMAPEQAAGDPGTDHRADIYAFGLLAYELLALVPPFADRAPREMLAAHIAEAPVPITDLRPGTPPALAALVMRCLEKRPDDRPQSAAEIREALEAFSTPGAGTVTPTRLARPPRRRMAVAAGGIAALLVALVAALAVAFRPAQVPIDENTVAVAPFRVLGADPTLQYLREGMLDLLSAKLTGEGGPRSADPRAVLSAWRRAAGSDSADLPRERLLEVAERLGAGQLLTGFIGGTPQRVVLSATLLSVRDGRSQAQATVEGPADSLPHLVDQLTARLLALEAGEGERLGALTSTSLPALRAYLEGKSLYRIGRYQDAAAEFERALSADSTFALAGLGLASASTWYGNPAAGARGLEVAWRYRGRLNALDEAYLMATAGPRYPDETPIAELQEAQARYAALAPERPDAWFALGDGLFHFGPGLGIAGAHDSAALALRRAISLDSAYAPAIEHLLLLEAKAGDVRAARQLSSMFLTLDPKSENVDGVRWRVAVAAGDQAALQAIDRRADSLSAVSAHTIISIAQQEGIDIARAARVLEANLEKPSPPTERYSKLIGAQDFLLNMGHPTRARAALAEYAPLVPGRGREIREQVRDAIFSDGDRDVAAAAAEELERFAAMPVGPTRLDSMVRQADRCVLEYWKLAQGDTSSVRRTLDAIEREGTNDPTSAACVAMIEATHATLARRADAPALALRLDSLLRTGPGGASQEMGNLMAARLLEVNGEPERALAAVRRREYFINRLAYLSTYLREEGRLAAQLGDREGAIRAYRHYLALRARPEPSLLPDVNAVRDELARLEKASAGQ